MKGGFFHKLAGGASHAVGSPYAFLASVALIVGWLVSGPVFGYSDTWQLIINTTTTIVTFLMVFLIQNTQNRDSLALHLKLDELIRATKGARNSLIDLAKLSDEQLHQLEHQFERLCADGAESAVGPELARTRQHRHRRRRERIGGDAAGAGAGAGADVDAGAVPDQADRPARSGATSDAGSCRAR
ncbi:MAG TPA: low affinity iron permease family protein [Kofleriaceae bacterium]|nr:low affinity iron permease family protein [Kofleriaceae bacterium]